MDQLQYRIEVFSTFEDDFLKSSWRKLEDEENLFPQMRYDWIEPWWRLSKSTDSLYIIAVLFENTIVGIAPFAIIDYFGIKILRSIPNHFGDFYSFLISKESSIVQGKIMQYCRSFAKWHVVEINQINSQNEIFKNKELKNIYYKKLSDLVYTNIDYPNFDEFLKTISKKQKKEYLRRERRLKEIGDVGLVVLQNQSDYDSYAEEMKAMYMNRWQYEDSDNLKTIFEYRREAYGNMLDKKLALGFVLVLNNKPVAYRLGFIYKKNFVSWKLVYDLEFQKYGLGVIASMRIFNYLLENKYLAVNNGVGEYDYKTNWFNNEVRNTNYTAYIGSKSLFAKGYIYFQTQLKEKFKKYKTFLSKS